MFGAKAARVSRPEVAPRSRATDLFARVGAFLDAHGLGADPEIYAFAHAVVRDPRGPLAQAVERLTDGGVRLTRSDAESLGAAARVEQAPAAQPGRTELQDAEARIERMASEARAQVANFVEVVRGAQDEARGFGRDLAARAADMAREASDADEVVRLAAAMVARVRETEQKLVAATREADELRTALEEARVAARRDPLTGLANRRALEEAFAEIDRGRSLFLAVCDVDRFKRINDEHGHAVGDRVLRAIGGSLSASCEGQLVVRHGGEEFALLLSGVDANAAMAMLEGARVAVSERRFRTRDTDKPIGSVTLSAGLTEVTPDDTLTAALSRADRRLYAAKAAGRDRCCAA